MADDLAPQLRMAVRTTPGINPAEDRTIGRTIWLGTSRFISFLGTAVRPFAEAWSLSGGPGAQGGIILANFLQKFGHPAIQHMGEQVYVPRTNTNPAAGLQAFNQVSNTVNISTEASDSLQNVLAARYDAMTGSSSDIK